MQIPNEKVVKRPEIKLPENVPVDYEFDRKLKRFMKDVDKSGILQEVKARRYYRKPSELKREEQKKRSRK
jgi:ribosomal protein S21